MTATLRRFVRPLFPVNTRVRIGGGTLALLLLGQALFAYGPTIG